MGFLLLLSILLLIPLISIEALFYRRISFPWLSKVMMWQKLEGTGHGAEHFDAPVLCAFLAVPVNLISFFLKR